MVKVKDCNLDAVLERFDAQVNENHEQSEAYFCNGLEFELFEYDKDTDFGLHYDYKENIFSISAIIFYPNGGGFDEEIFLKPYSLDFYNKDFLKYKLLQLIDHIANGKDWRTFDEETEETGNTNEAHA